MFYYIYFFFIAATIYTIQLLDACYTTFSGTGTAPDVCIAAQSWAGRSTVVGRSQYSREQVVVQSWAGRSTVVDRSQCSRGQVASQSWAGCSAVVGRSQYSRGQVVWHCRISPRRSLYFTFLGCCASIYTLSICTAKLVIKILQSTTYVNCS